MRFLILIILLLLPVSTYADDYKSLIRFVIAKQNAGASLENQTQEAKTPESETAPAPSTHSKSKTQKECPDGSCTITNKPKNIATQTTYRTRRFRLFKRWR